MSGVADEMVAAGLEHHRRGERGQAEAIYRRVLAEWPAHADALHLLGVLAIEAERSAEAVQLIGRAVEIRPGVALYYGNLGEAYRRLGDPARALAALGEAIRLDPNYADAYLNLGSALRLAGRAKEAVEALRAAVRLRPQGVLAHHNLALALIEAGQLREGILELLEAVRLDPGFAEGFRELGTAQWMAGRIDASVAAFEEAIRLNPGDAPTYAGMGNTLKDAGRVAEAAEWLKRSVDLWPDSPRLRSSLIYVLQFHPAEEAGAWVAAEQAEWARRFVTPLAGEWGPHPNVRDPAKKLRVGYVSADFRGHVIGRNVLPLIENHDRERVEVFCYSDAASEDRFTERFRRGAAGWRQTRGMRDRMVAEMIRADGIDVLVDLSQHLVGSRLTMFATRPAPVQVSFAGYPAASGVPVIDYRMSDPYLEPAGAAEEGPMGGERLVRLPHSFWCFDPLGDSVGVNELPAIGAGRVTFGCLNNYCKVNAGVLELWAAVMREVGGSKLLVLSPEGSHRAAAVEVLGRNGVAAERVTFERPRRREEYLRLYHGIDVGLDTLPYNGHTTSLDAMWMGVPVVTLAGKTSVGRAGVSQLSNLGMTELIASNAEEFVRIAAEWARDLPRLGEVRRALRMRMEASPLMDAKGFARGIEKAYRSMWRKYCEAG